MKVASAILTIILGASGAEARQVTIEVHDMISASRIEMYVDAVGDSIIRFKDPTYAGYPFPSVSNSRENETKFCAKLGYKFAGSTHRMPIRDGNKRLVYDFNGTDDGFVRTSYTTGVAEINCRK